MANRMLRDSLRTSRTLAQASHGAERLFLRLTLVADDFGRFDADPLAVLAFAFPLMVEKIKRRQIVRWLDELSALDSIRLYEIEGKPFGYFPSWAKHQRLRNTYSRYPEPPTFAANGGGSQAFALGDGDGVGAGGGGTHTPRARAHESDDSASPVSANVNGHDHVNPLPPERARRSGNGFPWGGGDPAFAAFWALYPKKAAKPRAREAWAKLKPDPALVCAIMAGLVAQFIGRVDTRDKGTPVGDLAVTLSGECESKGVRFIRYASRWLNERGWEDEIPKLAPLVGDGPSGRPWVDLCRGCRAKTNIRMRCACGADPKTGRKPEFRAGSRID